MALFLLPLINSAAIAFGLKYLFGYAVAVFVAILASGGGLVTALLLVRCFGPRRGRIVAQITGVLLGASIYLLTQAPHWSPPDARRSWAAGLSRSQSATKLRLASVHPLVVDVTMRESGFVAV